MKNYKIVLILGVALIVIGAILKINGTQESRMVFNFFMLTGVVFEIYGLYIYGKSRVGK